jgi:hypothetical protein
VPRITKKQQRELDRENACKKLRKILKPGTTVYTILVHVSRSGMYRRLKVIGPKSNNITGLVSDALGLKWCDDGTVGVSGCGMDMGFHVVYNLSYVLYPKGFKCLGNDLKKGRWCPSNDHSNGDRNYEPHHHACGGYALRHSWL